MNNLHRELAPISDAAWADIEAEARRTFTRHVAGRRVVDVIGPAGETLSAVGTGHLQRARVAAPTACAPAVATSQPVVEFRVPFTRRPRGRRRRRARREGLRLAAGQGRRQADRLRRGPGDLRRLRRRRHRRHPRQQRPIPPLALPADVARVPDRRRPGAHRAAAGRGRRPVQPAAVRRRLHGGGRDHRPRLPDPRAPRAGSSAGRRDHLGAGDRRAPSCSRPAAATTSCTSGRTCRSATCRTTPTTIELYFQESLTFLVQTSEAGVVLTPPE